MGPNAEPCGPLGMVGSGTRSAVHVETANSRTPIWRTAGPSAQMTKSCGGERQAITHMLGTPCWWTPGSADGTKASQWNRSSDSPASRPSRSKASSVMAWLPDA